MARPKDKPAEGAATWLKGAKPECWCGSKEWTFHGIILTGVHPEGTGAGCPPPTTEGMAKFSCKKCHVVLEVDCHSAGIRTSPKQ